MTAPGGSAEIRKDTLKPEGKASVIPHLNRGSPEWKETSSSWGKKSEVSAGFIPLPGPHQYHMTSTAPCSQPTPALTCSCGPRVLAGPSKPRLQVDSHKPKLLLAPAPGLLPQLQAPNSPQYRLAPAAPDPYLTQCQASSHGPKDSGLTQCQAGPYGASL